MIIWPQIVIIVIITMRMLAVIRDYKKGTELIGGLLAEIVYSLILYAGGFWDVLLK